MAGTVAQVAFFVALIVVIVIHEAAHFGVAKWFGIKAIPAGGYVKIAGMNPYQETP